MYTRSYKCRFTFIIRYTILLLFLQIIIYLFTIITYRKHAFYIIYTLNIKTLIIKHFKYVTKILYLPTT